MTKRHTRAPSAVTRARVAQARVGSLATVTVDGLPHVVPFCFVLTGDGTEPGDTIVTAVDAKPKSTLALRRLANIAANPAASVLVDHYDDDWTRLWWVRIDGTARVVESGHPEREAALDKLVAKYDQYRAARPPGAVIMIEDLTWRSWP